jgi:trehalose-6-phosphatase
MNDTAVMYSRDLALFLDIDGTLHELAPTPNAVEVSTAVTQTTIYELKPAGFSKGTAIGELMRSAPFATHRPVFNWR